MINQEHEKSLQTIVEVITEEARRIGYGKIVVKITVVGGELVNIQAETDRSVKLPA